MSPVRNGQDPALAVTLDNFVHGVANGVEALQALDAGDDGRLRGIEVQASAGKPGGKLIPRAMRGLAQAKDQNGRAGNQAEEESEQDRGHFGGLPVMGGGRAGKEWPWGLTGFTTRVHCRFGYIIQVR